eukprot:CAMPEP_0172513800 /NCGR_PEP_ID=MMETSP1066-20121228/255483_1 /TAXON_ID=671091 /ORGANISM="Coscinodiscus wailesii, Strain CCMP2513" /LENGTH=344 /DNA_ID=CAMNT_0013294215 /DNA_START=51 /DNA_END=1082 /DNA_ORIENTATION=+
MPTHVRRPPIKTAPTPAGTATTSQQQYQKSQSLLLRTPRRELTSLRALVHTFLPPLTPPSSSSSSPPPPHVTSYYTHDLSRNDVYISVLVTAINVKLTPKDRREVKIVLWLLSTWIGTLLIFWRFSGGWRSFGDWTWEERTRGLESLRRSRFGARRGLANGLKRLICGLAYSFVEDEDGGGSNPYWAGMNYPGPYHRRLSAADDEVLRREGSRPAAATAGNSPNTASDASTIDLKYQAAIVTPTTIPHRQYDVIIIGSGAGGGVAAALLSAAGYTTLVLEKGHYHPPSAITQLESDAMDQMYERHSLLASTDGNVCLLAGSTLGGGTSINWACCLDTPEDVRRE